MAGAVFEAAGVYEEVIAPMVSEALSWCPGSTAARDFANYYAASSNGALQNITERANQLRCFAEELIEAKRAQCTLPCLSRRARDVSGVVSASLPLAPPADLLREAADALERLGRDATDLRALAASAPRPNRFASED